MRAAETDDAGKLADWQRLFEIGVDMVDHRLHEAELGGKGRRAEDVVVKRHRRFVGNRRGGTRRRRAPHQTQAAIGEVIDGRGLQLQHRASGRKHHLVDAQRFLAIHRDPEIFPAVALLQPVAMIVRHQNEQRVAALKAIVAVLIAQLAAAADRVLQHGEGVWPRRRPSQS